MNSIHLIQIVPIRLKWIAMQVKKKIFEEKKLCVVDVVRPAFGQANS